MFVSEWQWKTRKIIIPSPVQSYESLVSLKENTYRIRKKRKKEKKGKQERKNEKKKTEHSSRYV